MDYGGSWVQIPSGPWNFPNSQWVPSAIHFIHLIIKGKTNKETLTTNKKNK